MKIPKHRNTETPKHRESEAFFTLSKQKLASQLKILTDLNLKVSYSYKTNRQIGDILQNLNQERELRAQHSKPTTNDQRPTTEMDSVHFSIHAQEEIEMIKDKSKISFFTQAETKEELIQIINQGIKTFVIDNEIDLQNLLQAAKQTNQKINISIRMKFHEHRIGTGKYFVYGLPSTKVNQLIQELKDNPQINELGIHIHRKSQNTSEWEIVEELKDSINETTLKIIKSVNLGGGLPVEYKSYTNSTLPYILNKIAKAKEFLNQHSIQTIIEPGRFLAAPPIKLHTKIIQIQNNTLILNTTIYNCALDTVLTETKMLVEQELSEPAKQPSRSNHREATIAKQPSKNPKDFLLKGNSPTRDDIFRYKVKLKNPKLGDEITFINAGSYNYTTDFFGYKKLETKITE